MDFGLVPPEIQSVLMYSGPGPGPIATTAAAWEALAAELDAAAASYEALIADLSSTSWRGMASEQMASAIAPYLAWMRATAAQAVETATQVRAGTAAYEAAFAATVPPAAVEANKAELIALIATNIFGQNTAAIAANQAEYAEMWAQDAAAMYGYAAAAATATRLTSFTSPPPAADGADDTAPVTDAAGAGQGALQQGMQAVPQMLQQLALPAQAGAAEAVVDDLVAGNVATGTAVSGLSLGSAYHGAISSVNFFQRMATQFVSQFSTSNAPTTTDIMERVNRIGLATGAIDPSELEQEMHGGRLGLGGFGDWRNWEHWLRGLGSGLGKAFLSAHTGQASTVGVLSVPPSWTAVPPELQLAALEIPEAAVASAPAVSDGPGVGVGNLVAATAAAGMAGRALAGTVGGRETTAGRDRVKQPASADESTATVAEIRERAELLRELGDLREAGLLSDAEFMEQKRQVINAAGQRRGR
ncbi:PPE family protein [[Mycobacterium] kokjensenii]|uniref:PPE family protein n=1 Tax=[Mycobacterium] kokjensenii TaxID=3064287 RepID=A0ABN9ND91_9MYCO|nr:PPE family protein [Mycolicibacter sp. MU0083]CAJ1502952.1 PPE family protein [Mycolicibacter sp. MU0083]